MKKFLLGAAALWLSVAVGLSARGGAPQAPRATAAQAASAAAPAEYHALITKYCVTCHNEQLKTPAASPLLLDKANLDNPAGDIELWEKVVHKLALGAMPPQGSPHPEPQALAGLKTWLADSLDHAADAANQPGLVGLHRLNRTEYANAIRDLFGLSVDVTALLPPDSSDFGFDNIASALKVTPALLEQYLTAAIRVSSLAVGNPRAESSEEKFPINLNYTQTGHIEGLPLGTRGGILVRHNFPADGEYVLTGALFRTVDSADSGIEGQDTPNEFQILVDGIVVHTATFGGPDDHVRSRRNMTAVREEVAERLKVRVPITAGPHDIGFTFVARAGRTQDIFEPLLRGSQDIHVASELPKLRHATINGPYNASGVDSPVRTRLFTCTPRGPQDETRCAREILSTVARRAYRRPVTNADLQPLMTFYEQGRSRQGTFEAGVRQAIPRILTSPSFLFRVEEDAAALAPGAVHAISDLELASRLSFFLWSSIPDDELLTAATSGRLRAPGGLAREVRRMIADERASALTTSFPDQWLALRNLEKVQPDLIGFPNWDLNLRQAAQRETELFFDSVVRGNRGALDLVNADYTFLNERLARHYGVPGVYGTAFRRVSLSDPNRRGLLGQASILALTSVATRTSPVFRGKWILTNLLDAPPPPPPPNVPALEENTGAAAPKSVRERLEAHRRNPVCASCHRNMDPIGFALEGFDAVGQWHQTTEAGTPVDASGVLLDGTAIDGPTGLRQWLTAHPDVFVGTVTGKLLTYALGRGLEPFDMSVVRKIVRDAAKDDYRFEAIITGIVQSRPFQMRAKPAEK